MARYTGPKCKRCRREGAKLFLKGDRCYSAKCPIERKGAVPPGQHGARSFRKLSEYGQQLREKQKAKRLYGVLEGQFRNYYKKASLSRASTGEVLLRLLESRLDNVVYRMGIAPSRSIARQLVSHGNVLIDGKKTTIASYQIKPGQVISLKNKALEIPAVKKDFSERAKKVPSWLDRKGPVGKVTRLPEKEEMETGINEQLIVEYYSK
ncbi:MAG: 30S ribosomal protein S4 [Patescibacteria group bacterium]|nr:30S ribosomal protein S4 [Patescibacteria group bacterium]